MNENEVLDRIQELLQKKHWTIYRLAKNSGLPYSSLNNIFVRNTCPSVITLSKICDGFGISLKQFFDYKENPFQSEDLTEDEQQLVNSYRTLSKKNKELLEAYLAGLSKK